MKDKFIKAYTENITRPGADKLLAWIESSDFFTAPVPPVQPWRVA